MREWRVKAGDLRGLIGAAKPADHERIGTEIQVSIGAATQAKLAMQDGHHAPMESTEQLRAAIATVVESVSIWLAAGAGHRDRLCGVPQIQ